MAVIIITITEHRLIPGVAPISAVLGVGGKKKHPKSICIIYISFSPQMLGDQLSFIYI